MRAEDWQAAQRALEGAAPRHLRVTAPASPPLTLAKAVARARACAGAGAELGVQQWRMSAKLLPEAVPEAERGRFCAAGCYIVLRTSRSASGAHAWDLHFWLLAAAPKETQGAAAITAALINDMLGGATVQHREVRPAW